MSARVALRLSLAFVAASVIPSCGGCGAGAAAMSLEEILSIAANTVALLTAAKEASASSAQAIQSAFADLESDARADNLTPARIKHMERTEEDLKERSAALASRLKEAHDSATSLFSKLKDKAKVNKTEEYRDRMLKMLEAKREEFDAKFERAGAAIEQLDKSIQKYSDILNLLQVSLAIAQLDFDELDQVTRDAHRLNEEAGQAISDGLEVVRSIDMAGYREGLKQREQLTPVRLEPVRAPTPVSINPNGKRLRCTSPWAAACPDGQCDGLIGSGERFRIHLAGVTLTGARAQNPCSDLGATGDIWLCLTPAAGRVCLSQRSACAADPACSPESVEITGSELRAGVPVEIRTGTNGTNATSNLVFRHETGLRRVALCRGGYGPLLDETGTVTAGFTYFLEPL